MGDQDGSSRKVEQTDESFRRQMELEDARSRDRTYVDTTYVEKIGQEKIDKLPEESRDNIRDQLVDVIMENGEWEPKDALEEYPYQPSVEAQSDAELKEQEQEAWDEQIEKYHEREAGAFGSHKGPVPGPGNPTGQQGGQQSQQGQQGGEQGSGQGGSGGKQGEQSPNTAGTYKPGASGSEDETSTAGVSESALDFLKSGRTGRQQQNPASSTDAQAAAQAQAEAAQAQSQAQAQAEAAQAQQASEQTAEPQQAEAQSEEAQQESQEQVAEQTQQQTPEQEQTEQEEQQASQQDIPLDTRGIIPIRDLDKLEGTGPSLAPQIPEDPEDSEDP